MPAYTLRPIMLGLLVFGSTGLASADDLDRFVQTHGRIVGTRTYGTTARNGKAAVKSDGNGPR